MVNTMLKLCLVNAFFHPYTGGVEKHMYELSRRLAKKMDVHVITSLLDGTSEEEELEGVHVHRIPATFIKAPLIYPPPLTLAPKARKAIREFDKKFDYNAFHLHGRWFPDFGYSEKYAHANGKKFFMTLHNQRPLGISLPVSVIGTVFDHAYGARLLGKADTIISVSHAAKKDISHYHEINEEKIRVIHNGVDTNFFKPVSSDLRQDLADGYDNVMLFLGRLIKQKGVEYLIQAMPKILEENPSTVLLITGKGKSKPGLMKLVKKKRLKNNVKFTGFIPEEQLPALYSASDVYVLPSLWEVLPISLLEALACGVPLVSSNAGGNAEIVEHGRNGFVFKMRDVSKLAEYTSSLLSDPSLRKRMGKESRRIAEKKFDWDIIARKTYEFYKEVIP